MTTALIFLVHMLGWFVIGALSAVLRGSRATIKWSAAIMLGAVSASLQLLLQYLGYIHI